MLGSEAFRVELEPFQCEFLVADCHYDPIGAVGRDNKVFVQMGWVDYQGMVAHSCKGIGQGVEYGQAVVFDERSFSVHAFIGPDDIGSEGLCQTLMSQADAQNWNYTGPL